MMLTTLGVQYKQAGQMKQYTGKLKIRTSEEIPESWRFYLE